LYLREETRGKLDEVRHRPLDFCAVALRFRVPRFLRRGFWHLLNVAGGIYLLFAGGPIFDAFNAVDAKLTPGHRMRVAAPWVVFAAIALMLPIVLAQRQRRILVKKECTSAIRRLLSALSECFPEPNRTNIMLTVDSPSGKRRRVNRETAHNMDNDPDNELEIEMRAGVSGQAVIERAFVWGDLTIASPPGAPSWGLRKDEQGRVRPTLQTILSAPIVDPDHPDGEVLGTLQVDSDLAVGTFVPKIAAAGKITSRFADVVALLLRERE
jgi:hypothetical protein